MRLPQLKKPFVVVAVLVTLVLFLVGGILILRKYRPELVGGKKKVTYPSVAPAPVPVTNINKP